MRGGGDAYTSARHASYPQIPQPPKMAPPSGTHVFETCEPVVWGCVLAGEQGLGVVHGKYSDNPVQFPWFTQLTSQLLTVYISER